MPRALTTLLLVPFAFAAASVSADEAKPTREAALKAKLKPHEDKLAALRDAMLKDCDDELKALDEAIRKAEKASADAAGAARGPAFQEVSRLRAERMQVGAVRAAVERRIHLDDAHRPVAAKTEEQRLGIATAAPNGALAAQLGLKKDVGVVLEKVDADAPAAKLGLKKHDVLVQLDGKPVPSGHADFRKLLAGLKADAPLDAVVVRAGKQETVKGFAVPAAEKSDKPAAPPAVPAPKLVKDPK